MATHSAFDLAAPFSAEAAAAAPLHFIYQMTPLVAIATTVTGDARQYAAARIDGGNRGVGGQTHTERFPQSVDQHVDASRADRGASL